MMYISTETDCYKKYGSNEKILELLKNAGFEAYDFSMFIETPQNYIFDDDYKEKALALRKYADSIGIVCNQTHAPFPARCPKNEAYARDLVDWIVRAGGNSFSDKVDYRENYNETIVVLMRRAIEISGILGAKACVVHPYNDFTAEENYQMYRELIDVAKESNVLIALENMWNWNREESIFAEAACSHHEDFKKHMDLLEKDRFVACLDIGHANLVGLNTSVPQMVRALGDRLACLHLHDNNGLKDSHKLPYTDSINFSNVIDALAEIDYNGDITMEASSYPRQFGVEFYPQVARFMYEVGDYLRTQLILKKSCR